MLKRRLVTSKTAQKWAGHQKDRAWLEGWDYVPHPSLSLRGKSENRIRCQDQQCIQSMSASIETRRVGF